MTRFVFARARGHRLLLSAALLTVVLTTAVLATLTAYSAAIGDAALRHVLADPQGAADTALIVKADVPPDGRAAADAAVRAGARRTFDGLPVTFRTLRRSGPYALPRSLQPPAARSGDPDLTYLAALDGTQLRLAAGRLPRRAEGAGGTVEVALPQTAARALRLAPGDRLTLTDRLGGPAVRVRITGLYRPVSVTAPYWQLDDLLGRGVKKAGFTTYGPLLADSSVLTRGRVSAGSTAWLASADFGRMTTARIGRLRTAARAGGAGLRDRAALHGTTVAQTSLPDVLDRIDRSLLVARSTLLIVTLQLVLLAGYALLLVARLLSTERTEETRLLRARGASRARLAALASAEALLLALPAAGCAPLLAGPLTALLAGHGPLARLGLHLDLPPAGRPLVWLVAATAALGCALAVTVPAVAGAGAWAWDRGGRPRWVPVRRGGRRSAASGSTLVGWGGRRSAASGSTLVGWGGRRSARPGPTPTDQDGHHSTQPGPTPTHRDGHHSPPPGPTPTDQDGHHSPPPGPTPTHRDGHHSPPPGPTPTGRGARHSASSDVDTRHTTPPGSSTRHSTQSRRGARHTTSPGSGARQHPARPLPLSRRPGVPRPAARPASAGTLRAGADLGLLAVAGVAYWQLGRQGSGGVAADRSGALGVDPLLVAAPALALLAGTVLTLRLLPPVARFAERWAAGGRGLPVALAGWQFSRRTARAAGPVLLVLAVALGMLAIGQAASWGRSQDDQADFRAGVPVRVVSAGEGGLGRTDLYARLPHVREAAPAVRFSQALSGDRTATVLALDTGNAADAVLMRPDLADVPVRSLLAGLAPRGSLAGTRVPKGTARLGLTASLRSSAGPGLVTDVTVTLADRYGVPYQLPFGQLPADGHPHPLSLDVSAAPGPLTLTGLHLDLPQPGRKAEHRLELGELTVTGADGRAHRLALPTRWKTAAEATGDAVASPATSPTRPIVTGTRTFTYSTGYLPDADAWRVAFVTIRLDVPQRAPATVPAVAGDRYLASAGARVGQRVGLTIGDHTLPVRIVRSVRGLPATADPTATGARDGGAVLVDLRAVNQVLQARYGAGVTPAEWWLATGRPGDAAGVAAAVRALPDVDPGQVVVRDEIAAELRDDPFGAGPAAACTAAAVVAAALAAVGFAVGAAAAQRARGREFAVLRALGVPRRRLARTVAAEQAVLVGLALAVGLGLGTVLARAVLPLIVLTGEATRPVPGLLVQLPPGRVALLLCTVAVVPLTVTALPTLRRTEPARALREQGDE